MEHRRYFENNMKTKIKQMNCYNRRDTEKITRLSNLDDEYSKNQVRKSEQDIQQRNDKIKEFKDQILRSQCGEFDAQFMADRVKNQMKLRDRNDDRRRKHITESEHKKQQDQQLRERSQNDRNEDKRSRNLQKDIDRSYKYYCKVCDNIPDYILKNLKEMPNNKGYIWKDVYLYGELPSEDNKPRVMFEKPNREVLYIHEWYNGEYKKFEKVGKNRKQLVMYKTYETKKGGVISLMDFIK